MPRDFGGGGGACTLHQRPGWHAGVDGGAIASTGLGRAHDPNGHTSLCHE
jgi:hypothetical protein